MNLIAGNRAWRVAIALLVVGLVGLAPSALAGAGGTSKQPTRPAHYVPSTSGLAGADTSGGTVTKANGAKQPNPGTITGVHPAAPGAVGATTLVLYDTTGSYGWLGELYATYVGNLASHFGTWTAEPVTSYQAGQIGQYTATIYIGSTYDEPLPASFLDDVYNSTRTGTSSRSGSSACQMLS